MISKSEPWADETVDLVEDLREAKRSRRRCRGPKASSYVGGQTAGYIDLASQISDKLPLMIAIVVALSFIVLLVAFRSLLVPVKAAAMNLLSVAAAYGVVTAVFQLGWGSSLIGLDHAIPIVSFVPLLMFAILFGLSMDYEVFLLTQMREHYEEYGDERRAVVEGLANTGRVITSAAAIMVCVFTSFVLSGNPVVKEFGVGLAVAIAIDSTLVRCLLVPAVMVLLGKRAWWLPRLDGPLAAEGQHRGRGVLRQEGRRRVFPLNLPNALTLLRILAVPVVVVALLGETPNGDTLRRRRLRPGGGDRRPRRLLRPLPRLGHHLRQADGPARRQAADHRRPDLPGLARPPRSLGGDGDHRPRGRGHDPPHDRRRARHRHRRQLAGKLKTVLQIAAIIALIATNPAPLGVDILVYVALAVTVISGVDYFFGLRKRIEELERERAAAKLKRAA